MASSSIPNDADPSTPLVVVNLSSMLKLNSVNYLSWHLQLQATLFGYGLFKFLDGTHPPPAPTLAPTTSSATATPNPAYLTWLCQDRLLFGAIIGTLKPTIVPLVSCASTAKDAWDILSHTYARQSRGHLKLLKTRFKNLTKGSSSITDYINSIRMCVDQRLLLRDTVLPEDVIEQVCDGIQDPAYTNLIESINARDTLISFNELHEKLLVREDQLTTIKAPPLLPVTAHSTSTRPSHATPPSDLTTRPSSYAKPSSSSHKKPTKGYQGKCQWCHTFGHSLYKCPSFQEKFPNAKPTLPPSSSQPRAHLATNTAAPNSSWLLDSGASHHITNDLANLSLHHPYDGTEEIVIGDGTSISITHIGSLTLLIYHTYHS